MGSFANVQNLSRIKPMRRILSFHGFNYSWICYGFLCAWRRWIASSEGKIRKNPCANGAHNPNASNKNPWKNRSVASVLSVSSLNACGRREAMNTWYMITVWRELYSRKAKQKKYQWIKTTKNIFIHWYFVFMYWCFREFDTVFQTLIGNRRLPSLGNRE